MAEVSASDLLKLIIEADDEALAESVPPKGRFLSVIPKVMAKLGIKSFVLAGQSAPPIVHRITALHQTLYRSSDLAIGGVHGGIFMFRDIFARIHIPIIYGQTAINPFTLTDLSEMQIRWLASRPADVNAFIDQFANIFDFAAGLGNFSQFKQPPKEAQEMFWLAAFQLQAAAATLSVAFALGGAVQSAVLAAELSLKAALTAVGYDEKQRKKIGHDLVAAANALGDLRPEFGREGVVAAIAKLPAYVQNRYSSKQPGRVETGDIVMHTQFISGEAMRCITAYSVRSALKPSTEHK